MDNQRRGKRTRFASRKVLEMVQETPQETDKSKGEKYGQNYILGPSHAKVMATLL